ncbi:ABC transporter ATP-binding protein [Chryseomicrobium sp. FSL W7-1435]|uniref:ABC transporter ATP-binding protein n=1 Tax=Chryseomicrobium sp. FSL W7-1435 TaxID=2921704 RepID=UPI00315A6E25
MIELKDVSKTFLDGTKALDSISVTIPEGSLTVVIGPSGCGKTTLMKCINQLEKPSSGTISIHNKPISSIPEVELRRDIGYVIQRIGLFPHMTIEKNASLVPQLKKWPKDKTNARIRELMSLVGLEPDTYLERYPLELSGGQQQRIGFVRALAADPSILLMDEPFSALDPISREQLQDELISLHKKIQKTIVFVTHDMDEALKVADHIILMKDGKIEQMGTPNEIIQAPANEFVTQFIGLERLQRNRSWLDLPLHALDLTYQKELDPAINSFRISNTASVRDAILQFEKHQVSHLMVANGNELVGFIDHFALLQTATNQEVGV